MRPLKSLLAVVLLFTAFHATAISHTFTGTIDTPGVLVWIEPGSTVVTPYITGGSFNAYVAYVDATTGYIWALTGPALSTPALNPVEDLRQYYTTNNCTGTTYAALPQTDFAGSAGVVIVFGSGNGLIYAATGPVISSASIQSEWHNGSCIAPTAIPGSFVVYTTTGPITAPTLPAGPYHLEMR